ncbi:hypothetical protein EI94DRAFT_1705742 [Lactarius quietus]|nr:hypothetical protein EI94DRAFT_1705742 [Lactarius quietus]
MDSDQSKRLNLIQLFASLIDFDVILVEQTTRGINAKAHWRKVLRYSLCIYLCPHKPGKPWENEFKDGRKESSRLHRSSVLRQDSSSLRIKIDPQAENVPHAMFRVGDSQLGEGKALECCGCCGAVTYGTLLDSISGEMSAPRSIISDTAIVQSPC